jgi:hypothetical protein
MPSAEAAGTRIGRSRWRYPRRRRSDQQVHSRTLRPSSQNRRRGVRASLQPAVRFLHEPRTTPPATRNFVRKGISKRRSSISQIRSLFSRKGQARKSRPAWPRTVSGILAEPMVRIRFPPAESLIRTIPRRLTLCVNGRWVSFSRALSFLQQYLLMFIIAACAPLRRGSEDTIGRITE